MLGKIAYKLFRNSIHEALVTEFIGCVPTKTREPALEFLADRKGLFESFLEIQAYNMQKRMVMDNKNGAKYEGALLIIRAFLAAVSAKSKTIRENTIPKEKINQDNSKTDLSRVDDFLKNAKDFIK